MQTQVHLLPQGVSSQDLRLQGVSSQHIVSSQHLELQGHWETLNLVLQDFSHL
jgi:hypothetical protein